MNAVPTPRAHDNDDRATASGGVILPGGKVDADALRRILDSAEADDDAELRRVTFSLRRDLRKRLDRYLTDRITYLSRTQLQRLITDGGVLVNGEAAKASTVLHAGDRVEVVLPTPRRGTIAPEEIELDVLFEDDDLIVLDKRPDIIVHPARSHLSGTLVNALAWRFERQTGGALSAVGAEFARPGVVHRLDRHTTGVIVFAKRDEAHWRLAHQFEHRTVEKRYIAVVHGRVEPAADVIDLPIGPHPSREKGYREKYVVRHDELGKPSVTVFHARERYRLHDRPVGDQHYSTLELDLRTGRTHQIRVHLADRGWSIAGDDMYGGRVVADATGAPILARPALHAAYLRFRHPATGTPMEFTAPLRDDMAALVGMLRRGEVDRPEGPGARVDLDALLGKRPLTADAGGTGP